MFGGKNTLTSSYAIFELISLLTRYQVKLPANIETFKKQLHNAYQTNNQSFDALSQEAQLIYSIWQAWHQQMADIGVVDKDTIYQLKLGANTRYPHNEHFYLMGTKNYLPSEIQWIKSRLDNAQITVFLQTEGNHISNHPDALAQHLITELAHPAQVLQIDNPRSKLLSLIFASETAQLRQRVLQAKEQYQSSPLKNNCTIYTCATFEVEAQAIQLQIRRWLSQGLHNIGLLLEDRQLARRVRALLERYGIGINDSEGWALSTSAAASIIESLLESIEENFNHIALLNLLKSPFVFPQDESHTLAVSRLELEVLQYERVFNDLNRYMHAIKSRQQRLKIAHDVTTEQLIQILLSLQSATTSLTQIHEQQQATIAEFINAFKATIKDLGIDEHLRSDSAGQEIIKLFDNILTATQHSTQHCHGPN